MDRAKRAIGTIGWTSVAGLFLLFLGICPYAGSAEPAAAPAIGRVSGVVADRGGTRLGEAQVKFAAKFRGMQITVISGKNGVFGVDLPAGSYRVITEHRGYADHIQDEFVLRAGQKAEMKVILNLLRDGLALESQINGSELLSILPPEDRQALINRCGACHQLGLLGGKRLTPAAWTSLVERMSHKEPGGRAEAVTWAPWEPNPWDTIPPVLTKHFSPGAESHRYEPLPVKNTLDHISKVVIKEYDLPRAETNPHDMAADPSGKRVWYGDQESGEVVKKGLFGWFDPVTGESKEYKVPECIGLTRILPDKSGRVWTGCEKALAYWDPKTEQVVSMPLAQYGMRSLWATDSKGNAYSLLRGRAVGDPDEKSAYVLKYDLQTKEWTKYKIPSEYGHAYEANADSKDNIWLTEIGADKLAKLDPKTGQFAEYPVPTKGGAPRRFAIDSKDNVWFTEFVGNKLGVVDSRTGKVTEYEVPTPYSLPYACGVDSNGIVWFSAMGANRLVRFDPKTKTFREYPIPSRLS